MIITAIIIITLTVCIIIITMCIVPATNVYHKKYGCAKI